MVKNRIGLFVTSVLLSVGLLSCGSSERLVIVEDNGTDYRIVVGENATDNELYAASFLQQTLNEVSNVVIPIVRDSEKSRAKEICIGRTNRDDDDYYDEGDGFIIKSRKDKIFIKALNPDSPLYGVVDFLEREIGVRIYASDCRVLPQAKSIEIAPIKERIYKSPNTFRQVRNNFTKRDEDLRFWLKQHLQTDVFADGYFVHTFNKLVPRDKYFDSNPEFFAFVNGKRVPYQLCLSNDTVKSLVKQRLREEMALQPDKEVWSVSQNDNPLYCHCERCEALIDRYKSPAGPIVSFVNDLARSFPDKQISTLAYQYSRKAPVGLILEPNVQIMLCTIEEDRSKTIEQAGKEAERENKTGSFADDLRAWSALTDNLFVWDYDVDFDYSVMPFPNMQVLKPNISFFVENGVRRHFQQANGETGHEFSELKTYLLSSLLWNPDASADSIMNDFIEAYYQEAAPHIRNYIRRLQEALAEKEQRLDIYAPPTAYAETFLSQEKIEAYSQIFDVAQTVVSHKPQVLLRVRVARLPLQYAIMEIAKSDMYGERGWYERVKGKYVLRKDMRDMLEEFYDVCKQAGVESLNESNLTPKQYYESTLRFISDGTEGNHAFRKKVSAEPLPSVLYSGGALSALTDGVRGTNEYRMLWLGWQACDFELNVDLEDVVDAEKITVSTLYCPKSWILHPKRMECQVSKDGKRYVDVGAVETDCMKKEQDLIKEFSFELNRKQREFRYVRLKVFATKTLPSWHASAGEGSWTFIDEIVVE